MIPVIMVTGFLGSGKTSLIANQLDKDKTNSLAVVVHDIGEENIDVAYLKGGELLDVAQDERIRSISSGPLTASHEKQLIQHLDELAAEKSRPSAILVEASGAADAGVLIQKLKSEKSGWELISVVTVIDVSLLSHYLKDQMTASLLTRQISAASLLVLNKWDRTPLKEKIKVRSYIGPLMCRAQTSVVRARFGKVSPRNILQRRSICDNSASVDLNTESAIVSVHLKERIPFHPERLEKWLSKPWPGVIRVKGFIWLATDMDGIYVIDAAGPQRELGLEGTWYASAAENELKNDERIQQLVAEHPWGDRRQMLTVIGSSSGVAEAAKELDAALLYDQETAAGPEIWKDYPDPLTSQFK